MGWGGYYDGFYLVNKDLSITFDTSNGSYDRNFSMIYNIINKLGLRSVLSSKG